MEIVFAGVFFFAYVHFFAVVKLPILMKCYRSGVAHSLMLKALKIQKISFLLFLFLY